MARRRRLPSEPVTAEVTDLAHDGRGVAHLEGKTVFIDGALVGEEVRFVYTARRRNHDEGRVVEVLRPATERVAPRCPHFGVCGGCSLQHLAPQAQIQAKQRTLMENLRRLGKVEPEAVLAPLTGPTWGYRGKARLGVKFVAKKGRVLVGFRERGKPYIADLERCEVLHPAVGEHLPLLAETVAALEAYARIPQIEVAVADEGTALVFRHLDPLGDADRERLRRLGTEHDYLVFLQPKGPESIVPLEPEAITLSYRLAEAGVRLQFGPADFTQVNAGINPAMVARALDLLELGDADRLLELFCGLGNFSLPAARRGARVTGVEGEVALVERARANAEANGLAEAARFHSADLFQPEPEAPWLREPFNKVLLDPPRSGAREVLEVVAPRRPERLVYVSCNPATLARDAGALVHEHGYRLVRAGVMDMFPHTAHVESIALLVPE